MICPKCRKSTLKEILIKNMDVKVDKCSQCHGIWFDGVELEATVPEASKELSAADAAIANARLCPRCYKVLMQFEYPQTLVKIDMCKLCDGVWLDADELKEIRIIRGSLMKRGIAEEYAPVTGVKGVLLHFIDQAISELNPFDEYRPR